MMLKYLYASQSLLCNFETFIEINCFLRKDDENTSRLPLFRSRHQMVFQEHCVKCVTICDNMGQYGFSMTRIFPYQDRIIGFTVIQKNTGHLTPVFSHISRSEQLTNTAQNTAISSNFLMWKFRGKAQYPQSCGRFAFP